LRVSYISVTDDDGNDWICVLPLDKDVLGTRLNPHELVWVPVDNVGGYLSTVDQASYEVIYRVLHGEDSRNPWIEAELSDSLSPVRDLKARTDIRPCARRWATWCRNEHDGQRRTRDE
jgi:hypothetical protein